jgi:hypothetical protein
MWPPAIPAKAPEISTPAICSASATAARMASTVESMLTTIPRLSPREGAVPTPMTFRAPRGAGSVMMAQTFVVPTSRPTTRSGAFGRFIGRLAGRPPGRGT